MKYYMVICTFLFFTLSSSAQDNDFLRVDWSTLTPLDEPFSTEVPIKMDVSSAGQENKYRRYAGKLGNTYFFIFSENVDSEAFLTQTPLSFVHSYIEKGKTVSLNGVSSELFEFADDEGFSHRILFCETKTRRLVFHALSRTKNNEMVDRFFDRLRIEDLRIIESKTKDTVSKEKPIESNSAITQNQEISRGSGSGLGSGSAGGGSGISILTKPGEAKTGDAIQSTSYKILSKQKAVYTDFARFYNVSGSVRLKVTLLANKTVGTITPITHLPFGLTKKAIEAAKSIEFEPKIVKGVPVSVLVTFDYGFVLY